MKTVWLGQAGLLIETKNIKIMVDPYLSDSVVKINPRNFRRVPVDEKLFQIKPDVMIFTHDHLDHYDPETAPRFISDKTALTVLCPKSVFLKVKLLGGINNYVQFDRHTEWTECGVKFTAVKAVHSDDFAIGVIIDDGEEKYYITGDTLYNEDIFEDIPEGIDKMFVPINGVGNNMNKEDASRFAKEVAPKAAVPVHFGMFDELTPDGFAYDKVIVPELYKEIK